MTGINPGPRVGRGRSRILILGGYGTFGGRLARLLSDDRRAELLIAGHSLRKAEELCATLPPGAERTAVLFERDADVDAQLRAIAPAIVVDAMGPFQAYGDSPYRIVEACLRHGAHYLDLADDPKFVRGIARFDDGAKTRGLFALSGVSTFPVLTAAAVRSLLTGIRRLDSISGGIAPSPYAGVGISVIRAIASYAGKSISIRRDARIVRAYPFTETTRFTIAVPGRLPLRPLRFSLVDVPDLEALPKLWPEVASVWMGAAPVPPILHSALRGLAWLVRLRILPTLLPLASLIHWTSNVLHWGEHRGGMFVEIRGLDEEGQTARSWHLLAEGDDGPFIPAMAAEAIIRRYLDGAVPAAGARPALRELELSDYGRRFEAQAIEVGSWIPSRAPSSLPLYRRLLGEAWDHLPEPIRRMHDLQGAATATGIAQIDRGRGWIARLVAGLFRFPDAGNDVPVEVRFAARDGTEIWTRRFGDRSFSSVQAEGRGEFDRLLCERFGPFAFGLALVLDGSRLRLVLRRWTFLGVPLPVALSPRGETYESGEDGRFHFHVEIGHPLVGLIVRYRGSLAAPNRVH
jgi:hypothetical protein